MYSNFSKFHFWGWQAIILAAALPYLWVSPVRTNMPNWNGPLTSPSHLVWVAFGVNMFGTIFKRRENHLYVAIWFYIATWVTVTVLHVGNNLELTVSMMEKLSRICRRTGCLDPVVVRAQRSGILPDHSLPGFDVLLLAQSREPSGIFLPLSIIHFWALIFIYIWAGPHHLLYTSLPDWAQSLGTVFSIMLIAPSWGGMLNGFLTLRGAWDRVRTKIQS
jgi:cytochrome c oxidase cbb3-type subunit I/II